MSPTMTRPVWTPMPARSAGLPSHHALDVQLCQLSLHRQRAADGALGVIGLGDQLRNGQPFGPLLVTPRERG
jgi:hypothetical protein